MNRTALVLMSLVAGCGGDEETFETVLRDGKATYADWAEPIDCDPTTYYEDVDGDGYGVDGTAVEGETCRPLAGYASQAGDCDDRSSGVSPGAPEICDGKDNDCDGAVDDDDSVEGAPQWYRDQDADGYGTSDVVAVVCEGPEASALLTGDCDDDDASTRPGRSEELGDGIDNNCDGLTDFVGSLDGTWSTAVGDGAAPGDWACDRSWVLDGVWDQALCPDCTLSFWMESVDDPTADPMGCALPSEEGFGLHVIESAAGGHYLGITYRYTYIYYGYSYYYYGTPAGVYTEYELTRMPSIAVTWDGATIQFEDGPLDQSDGSGNYLSDWLGFSGVME